ncbi:MAG: RNA polymerase sigma-70 factor [Chthoniobacter sp.]|nr:RNA polymerase sigma-70 factor [Chthoniobacter sp.]
MLETFQQHRPLLFSIAYRMLGSVAEAEDLMQETYLRWQRQSFDEIRSARAWLTSTITRLCIDELRSARRRREEYVGVWLPEPLVENAGDQHDRTAALVDSLGTAFLVLLETLSPKERAVFLLREVFEYEYREIAEIVETSEANCRQMGHRAKDHLAARQTRFDSNAARSEQLVHHFLVACRKGDTDGLLALLAEDAVLYSDGGGRVAAAPHPIVGSKRVARFLIGVGKINHGVVATRFAAINSAPGVLIWYNGRFAQTMNLGIVDGRVRALYVVRNPDKLKHLLDSIALPESAA